MRHSDGPPPPGRNDTGERQAMDKDGIGAGAGGREHRNASAEREAFRAAIAKGTAAPPQDLPHPGEGAALALILPTASAAQTPAVAAPPPADRVAALEALALRIEAELDVALRVSARALGGGVEVRLALNGAKLGLSGVTVTLRGAELSVQLAAPVGVNDQALTASAQALAASLANRFPQRIIRIERGQSATDQPAAPPTIADIFARRC
ncbi:MAG: hypothetical protein AAF318_01215 [Pseudomonadota bacterium]